MNRLLYALSALIVLVSVNGCQKPDQSFYVENPNWYVEYYGREWVPEYMSLIDYVYVDVFSSNERYLVGWETLDNFHRMGIEAFVDEWLYEYQMEIDYLNETAPYGEYYDWTSVSYLGDDYVKFEAIDATVPCVAVAFAIYSYGEPTGSFAVSAPFYPGEIAAFGSGE